MKKILSILLTIAMCFSLICTVGAEGEMNIIVSNAEVDYGATEATVEITIPNNPGISIIGFNVNYDDEALTLNTAALGEIFTGEFEWNLEAEPFMFTVYTGAGDKTASGTLVTLNFDINGDCMPGTYDITIDAVEVLNHAEDNVPFAVTDGYVKVNALEMTGITLKGATYTYDGSEKEILVTGTLPEGAEVNYEDNKGTDAGTYKAKAIVTKKGYNTLNLSADLVIKPVMLEIKGMSVMDKTYDKTADAEIVEGTLSGVIGDDDVEAVYPEKGTFAQVNVKSTAIAVSLDEITLTGEDAGNYTLKQPTGLKAKITKAPIEITADSFELTVGDEVPALTYTITDGELFGDDEITGALSTSATTSEEAEFSISKGTLKVSANYTMTFVSGKITVLEKPAQEITVEDFDEVTYGDEGFKLNVEEGSKVTESEIVFASSNEDVATIDAEGNITIKNAGKTEISVTKAGNEDYADFSLTQTLKVNKKEIKIIVTPGQTKKVGSDDPVIAYTYEGTLATGDEITGALARKEGEAIGTYPVYIGTLDITNGMNYDVTFVSATFEITEKTVQTITLAEIPALTYGDAPYAVTVTKDETANLEAYTYESDNEDVLTITDGVITIKAAGEATIKVTEPGNDEYAASIASQKVIVNKKELSVESVNLTEKTAVIAGVVDSDEVALDFNKLQLEMVEDIDESTSVVVAKNFVLTGEKAANYSFATEAIEATVAKNNIATVAVTADKGEIEGDGTYLLGAEVTLKAVAPKNYKFSGWYLDGVKLSGDSVITIELTEDKNLTAKFTKKSSGGGGGGGGGTSYCTVKFDTAGGSEVTSAKIAYGDALGEISAPTREGYVFDGWFLDKEFTTEVTAESKVKGNITLYARWTEKAKREIVLTIGDVNASVFGENKANDVAPVIRNDRTMLPARFVAEALGATVTWDEEARRVTITKDELVIVLAIDSDKATVKGEEVTLDSPAFIENDRTYTPIRFVAEALGATVAWEEETQKVTITVK
ncbi:MAG: InlB B-repeat-containing protein [Clostridia bacterium]|nr:InlB B-repeat-containing protein [Clostridia bacterium]